MLNGVQMTGSYCGRDEISVGQSIGANRNMSKKLLTMIFTTKLPLDIDNIGSNDDISLDIKFNLLVDSILN